MKHTPGPWGFEWKVNEHGQAECGVFTTESPHIRYSICRAPAYQTEAQWNIDARLIAAAPELLEALKDLYAQGCGEPKSCGHEFTCVCPGDKARAAIAKAEGK